MFSRLPCRIPRIPRRWACYASLKTHFQQFTSREPEMFISSPWRNSQELSRQPLPSLIHHRRQAVSRAIIALQEIRLRSANNKTCPTKMIELQTKVTQHIYYSWNYQLSTQDFCQCKSPPSPWLAANKSRLRRTWCFLNEIYWNKLESVDINLNLRATTSFARRIRLRKVAKADAVGDTVAGLDHTCLLVGACFTPTERRVQ